MALSVQRIVQRAVCFFCRTDTQGLLRIASPETPGVSLAVCDACAAGQFDHLPVRRPGAKMAGRE